MLSDSGAAAHCCGLTIIGRKLIKYDAAGVTLFADCFVVMFNSAKSV